MVDRRIRVHRKGTDGVSARGHDVVTLTRRSGDGDPLAPDRLGRLAFGSVTELAVAAGRGRRNTPDSVPRGAATSNAPWRSPRCCWPRRGRRRSPRGPGQRRPRRRGSPTPYVRAKAAVEAIVRSSGLAWAIGRPTLTFGDGDILLNNLAGHCGIAVTASPDGAATGSNRSMSTKWHGSASRPGREPLDRPSTRPVPSSSATSSSSSLIRRAVGRRAGRRADAGRLVGLPPAPSERWSARSSCARRGCRADLESTDVGRAAAWSALRCPNGSSDAPARSAGSGRRARQGLHGRGELTSGSTLVGSAGTHVHSCPPRRSPARSPGSAPPGRGHGLDRGPVGRPPTGSITAAGRPTVS